MCTRKDMKDDKIKVLDVRMPKEEQEKPEFVKKLKEKNFKYQVNVKIDGKVRFMYGDDPVQLEMYAQSIGAKILKTVRLTVDNKCKCGHDKLEHNSHYGCNYYPNCRCDHFHD